MYKYSKFFLALLAVVFLVAVPQTAQAVPELGVTVHAVVMAPENPAILEVVVTARNVSDSIIKIVDAYAVVGQGRMIPFMGSRDEILEEIIIGAPTMVDAPLGGVVVGSVAGMMTNSPWFGILGLMTGVAILSTAENEQKGRIDTLDERAFYRRTTLEPGGGVTRKSLFFVSSRAFGVARIAIEYDDGGGSQFVFVNLPVSAVRATPPVAMPWSRPGNIGGEDLADAVSDDDF